MNLNLHILRSDLHDAVQEAIVTGELLFRPLKFPLLYDGEKRPLGDRLYIAEAGDLPASPDLSAHPCFLCVGRPPSAYLQGSCDLLIIREGISVHWLLARTGELFSAYGQWELELHKANALNLPLKKLGQISEPIFKNPITVCDSNTKAIFVIVNDERYAVPPGYIWVQENSYMSLDDLNMLKLDPDFVNAANKRGPTMYPADLYGYRTLYQNIFINGDSYSCRILVDEINETITEKHFVLLDVFSEAVAVGLQTKDALDLRRPMYMDEILHKLLEHKLVEESKILGVLGEIGWEVTDAYFCVTVEPTDYDIANKTLTFLATQISAMVSSDCYLLFKNTIVFIFNLTAMGKRREEAFGLILPHLRDSLLKAGISTVFHDFKNLYYYYQQCLIALKIGKERRPMHWYYRFDDYTLPYIAAQCTKVLIPEALYPRDLFRLMEHDRQNGSAYVTMLRAYLDNNMSPTHTQRALYLHRNTFAYRLRRLLEILDMDLDDPDTRLHLQIALRL